MSSGTMKFDFHCHSHCSDGTLPPGQLIEMALERSVESLAITDHDSVAAYSAFPPGDYKAIDTESEGESANLKLISGCEFSALWNGSVIHIVGLDFDVQAPAITHMLESAKTLREQRAQQIGLALEKLGIQGAYEGAKRVAGEAAVGRPHFAEYLVESGVVPNIKKAFKKYLGKGKPGDVKVSWPDISEVIKAIRSANGVGVLAHPIHYDFTRTKLLRLIDGFVEMGGQAIEVVSGNQPPNQTQQLVEIATQRNLLCSSGSDFHRPGQPWADLGRHPALPKTAMPVWKECKSL